MGILFWELLTVLCEHIVGILWVYAHTHCSIVAVVSSLSAHTLNVRDTVWTADNEENTVLSEILFEARRAKNMIEDITVLSECLLHTVSNFQNTVFTAFRNNLIKKEHKICI